MRLNVNQHSLSPDDKEGLGRDLELDDPAVSLEIDRRVLMECDCDVLSASIGVIVGARHLSMHRGQADRQI